MSHTTYEVPGQSNLSTVNTFFMGKPAPIIAERIWDTKAKAEAYIADVDGSAFPGMRISITMDGNNNGLYYVKGTLNTTTNLLERPYALVKVKDANDTDANTWRNLYTDGTSRVGTGIDTKAINITHGDNILITYKAAGTGEDQSGSNDYFNVEISANNTDTKTTQTGITANDNYPILFKNTANTTDETNQVKFGKTANKLITANPSSGTITAVNFDGKINNHTVDKDVPSNAVFTDTTYSSGNEITISSGNAINHDALLGTAFAPHTIGTTISGWGGSGSFEVPVLAINEYGHVTNAGRATMSITLPSEPEMKITSYDAPTYDTTHVSNAYRTIIQGNAVAVNDTFNSAINKIDNKLEGLTDEVILDEAALSQAIEDEPRYFAKSSSGAAVTAMTATLVDSRNFAIENNKPINGTKVDVYFSTLHTTSTATLNINNTGAFTLVYNDSQFNTSMIDAGTILSLVFDKEYNSNSGCWRVVGGYVPIMSGATASADGNIGLVPKPLTGYQNKYLRGDGTWQDVSAGTTNTFNTIAVNGQPSVVADTSTDTLTLVAGNGVNITTDVNTDTVTFSATGSGNVGSQHMAAYSIIKDNIVTYTPMNFVTELFYPIVRESISNDTTIFIDKMRCYEESGGLDGHIPVGSIIIIYSCYLYSLGLTSGRFIWDTPGFSDYFNYIVCNGGNQLYETENKNINDRSILNSNGIYLYTFNWDGSSLPDGINDWVSTYAARIGNYNIHIGGSASNTISHKYIFHISDIEINENKADTITGFVDELKESPQAGYNKIKSGEIFNTDENESLFNKIVVSVEHRSVVSSEGANIFYPN